MGAQDPKLTTCNLKENQFYAGSLQNV